VGFCGLLFLVLGGSGGGGGGGEWNGHDRRNIN